MLIFFFLALNFFFVASEFAFVKIRITHMTALANQGSRRAKRVLDIIHDLDRSMSSTQLGISLASIGVGFVAERFFTGLIISILQLFGIGAESIDNIEAIGFFTGYIIGTYLHVVIGELVPKSLAIRFSEKTALLFAEPFWWFMKATNWFLEVLIWSANFVLRIFGVPLVQESFHEAYSEDELKLIIENSIESGELEEYESKLIYKIFEFTDRTAKEILTPRHEIKALPTTSSLSDVITLAKQTGHSRFPVYKDKIDDVVGFVHIKDALIHMDDNNGASNTKVDQFLRPVIIVHEGYPIDDLLKDMQQQQTQVAIIVDEWGSVEGIITIEDILEAIVGPINDEFDPDVEEQEIIEDEGIFVPGTISIDEFNEILEKHNYEHQVQPTGDAVTLAGYLLELNESKIPEEGSVISDGKLFYKILEIEHNRIEKVEVTDHLIQPKPEVEAKPDSPKE